MFGKKKGPQAGSTVLVPLYVYPDPGAWEPLFQAIDKHPSLRFTIVVNPSNGPGVGPTPDHNYTREIPRLNSFSNVRTVGYISTSWTNRDITSVLRDIDHYSEWTKNSAAPGLSVQGIFFDETPSVYTISAAMYLDKIASQIRSQQGFGTDPLIIHNPGTIPDPRYLVSCNQTVVFEGSYSIYRTSNLHKSISAFRKSSKLGKESTACIIHGIPSTVSRRDQNTLMKELMEVAGSLFITGLAVDYYASFWDGWQRSVDELAN